MQAKRPSQGPSRRFDQSGLRTSTAPFFNGGPRSGTRLFLWTALLATLTISAHAARFSLLHSSLDGGGGRSVALRFEAISSLHPMTRAGHVALLNHSPAGVKDHLPLPVGGAFAIPIADLLDNDSDLEENALAFSLSQTNSAHGGTLTLSNGVVIYAPPAIPNSRGDSFSYVVSDSFGGAGVGKVILFSPAAVPVLTGLQLSGTNFLATFRALPSALYMLQFRSAFGLRQYWHDYPNASRPMLQRADAAGTFQYLVPIGSGQEFFRAVDLESLRGELSFKTTGGQLAMNLRGLPNSIYKLQARATLDVTERWSDYPNAAQPFLVRAASDGIYQVVVPVHDPYRFFRTVPHGP